MLPAVPKLLLVGVGTAEAAAEFADKLGVDPSMCFADENGVMGDALGLEKGFKTMWNPPAVDTMMARNDQDSLKALGEAYSDAAKSIGFQRLAPKKIGDTLRQGGTFVFKGEKLLLEHYDSVVGGNCEIEEILTAIR